MADQEPSGGVSAISWNCNGEVRSVRITAGLEDCLIVTANEYVRKSILLLCDRSCLASTQVKKSLKKNTESSCFFITASTFLGIPKSPITDFDRHTTNWASGASAVLSQQLYPNQHGSEPLSMADRCLP